MQSGWSCARLAMTEPFIVLFKGDSRLGHQIHHLCFGFHLQLVISWPQPSQVRLHMLRCCSGCGTSADSSAASVPAGTAPARAVGGHAAASPPSINVAAEREGAPNGTLTSDIITSSSSASDLSSVAVLEATPSAKRSAVQRARC